MYRGRLLLMNLFNQTAICTSQACFSRRFDVEDEEFGKLFTKIFSDIKNLKFQAVLFMPWLAWIPPFSW